RRRSTNRLVSIDMGIDRPLVPQLADEPIVRLAIGPQAVIDLDAVVAKRLVKILVVAEQPAELQVLVGPPDLLAHEPAELPQKPRLIAVVVRAEDQELDALFHPLIAHP